MGGEDASALASVEFEVFGQVQELTREYAFFYKNGLDVLSEMEISPNGCYFTKYCKELAEQLGVGGWVKNSKKGTIVGKLQGAKAQLDHMIDWLSTTGSPGCKIEKCDLTNWEHVTRIDYHEFSIRF